VDEVVVDEREDEEQTRTRVGADRGDRVTERKRQREDVQGQLLGPTTVRSPDKSRCENQFGTGSRLRS
jgi:hypothetical protein